MVSFRGFHIHNFYLSCYCMAIYGTYDQVCIQYVHIKCILGGGGGGVCLRSVLRYAHAIANATVWHSSFIYIAN